VDGRLLKTNDEFNRGLSKRRVEMLKPHMPKGATVAVLGLSYKPLSHVIEESPGIYLCEALSDAGYRVIGHDNLAVEGARSVLKSALVTDNIDEALQDATVVIVTTTDQTYTTLTAYDLLKGKDRVVLVDFWRSLKSVAEDKRVSYIPAGLCIDPENANNALKELWQ